MGTLTPWAHDYTWQYGQPDGALYPLRATFTRPVREPLTRWLQATYPEHAADGVWYGPGVDFSFPDDHVVLLVSPGEDACDSLKDVSDTMLGVVAKEVPEATVSWEQLPPEPPLD